MGNRGGVVRKPVCPRCSCTAEGHKCPKCGTFLNLNQRGTTSTVPAGVSKTQAAVKGHLELPLNSPGYQI